MTILYCYYRYGVYCEYEAANVDEAISCAYADMESGQAAPKKIVLEDGTVIEREEVERRGWAYGDRKDGLL